MLADQHGQIIAQESGQPVWLQFVGALLLAGGAVLAGLGWHDFGINSTWAAAASSALIGSLLLLRR